MRRKKPQISQIWCRLRACWRTQDCQDFGNRKGTTATKNREAPAGRRTGRRPSCPRSPSCPRPRRHPRRTGTTGTTGTLNAPSPSSFLPLPSPSPAWRALARRGRAAGFRCAGYHKGSKNHREPKANLPRLRKQSLLGCLSGTSRTCRGCRGKGKFGSLEAWHYPAKRGVSEQARPADVPRVQGELPLAGVQGAAPLAPPSPSPIFSSPFVSFVSFVISISVFLCVSSVPSVISPASSFLCVLCVLRVLCDFQFSVSLCVSSVVSVVSLLG